MGELLTTPERSVDPRKNVALGSSIGAPLMVQELTPVSVSWRLFPADETILMHGNVFASRQAIKQAKTDGYGEASEPIWAGETR